MIERKFSEAILKNFMWKIYHNGSTYDARDVYRMIVNIIRSKELKNICADGYYIACGFGGFEYFLYIILSSFLGINIILCDSKLLDSLLENYKLNYRAILSSRSVNCRGVRFLKIDMNEGFASDNVISNSSGNQSNILFFTSGTTGIPKLVSYKEFSLLKNAYDVGKYLGVGYGDLCLCFFPINYMYGFSTLMSSLLCSGEVILERSTITAEEICSYLVYKKINYLPIIRGFVEKIKSFIENGKYYFESLIILNASDRIYRNHVRDILRICPVFWNNFGQTESGPRIFALKIDKDRVEDDALYGHNGVVSLGVPIDKEIHISILNQLGKECGFDEVGELNYITPYGMEGYLDRNGNLVSLDVISSGDMVYRNKFGNICWVGRKNEVIKINGRYINVALIQQGFDGLFGIKECYFICNNDGNILMFYAMYSDVCSVRFEEEINCFYRKKFPYYPRIDKFFRVDSMPRTQSGKISVFDLKNLSNSI